MENNAEWIHESPITSLRSIIPITLKQILFKLAFPADLKVLSITRNETASQWGNYLAEDNFWFKNQEALPAITEVVRLVNHLLTTKIIEQLFCLLQESCFRGLTLLEGFFLACIFKIRACFFSLMSLALELVGGRLISASVSKFQLNFQSLKVGESVFQDFDNVCALNAAIKICTPSLSII